MTVARLSPTANLLRNSKLFALPSSIALPPARPTAEPTADSDTATTIYPTKAALQTPASSLKTGDWGLKRALPLKSTTNTSTPTIRLRKHIDTDAHVADFESAADHVVTLNKWEHVNPQIINTPKWAPRTTDRRTFSVFHPDLDNTTNLTSSQKSKRSSINTHQPFPDHLRQALDQLRADQKAKAKADGIPLPTAPVQPRAPSAKSGRWRYDGPWLAGMSNLEYDTYLKQISSKQMSRKFEHFILTNPNTNPDMQGVEASAEAVAYRDPTVRHQRLQEIKRSLRSDRELFAAAIAEFLDLPDGPGRPTLMIGTTKGGDWTYARNTAATQHYKDVGPPRTHPSAGFSYVRSAQFARNDPKIGPAYPSDILPARLLKDTNPQDASGDRRLHQSIGVGGVVARQDSHGTRTVMGSDQWKPTAGGPKLVVKLLESTVQQDGALEVGIVRDKEYELDEDNVPYNKQDWQRDQRARRKMPEVSDRLEHLDQPGRGQYRRASPLNGPGAKADDDASDIMAALNTSFNRGER